MTMHRITLDATAARPQARRYFARAHGTDFAVNAKGGAVEIIIYDEIGYWGVTAADVSTALRDAAGRPVVVKINSPGGDVFDGVAIYNDLVAYEGAVDVQITGFAASSASLIAMAGDTITIADNAFIMIHNAWTMAVGNRSELEATARLLEQVDDAQRRTYAARLADAGSDLTIERIGEMMDAETWISGPEAVQMGFADSIMAAPDANASAAFDLSAYRNTPAGLRAYTASRAAPTERDIERALRDAGHTTAAAKRLVAALKPLRDAGDTCRADDVSAPLLAILDAITGA